MAPPDCEEKLVFCTVVVRTRGSGLWWELVARTVKGRSHSLGKGVKAHSQAFAAGKDSTV